MRPDSSAESVRQRYAELAASVEKGGTCCTPDEQAVFGASRYEAGDFHSALNVIASQLFRAAEDALGDQNENFARGEYAPLFGWLHSHVHRIGHQRTTRQIVETATGEPIGPAALVERLRKKARQLYDF